ncbi:uncharacterized protein BJ212DRAFT_666789 [Suillus subaureus]|uniref:Uncharacterized protein n=1 Tax=Suillus subaureus TaxID=48587 RepID=A0A9P7E0U5_9AGAM|nr:uncharacterized protein BJ212DRAFT_666789 [Suillus subaureus]KAG1808242.1 hypothetical protein BJ212DRAFT_666789 [Suillus subaureus]
MDTYRQLLDMFCGDISLSQFLVTVLTAPCFDDHPAVAELISRNDNIIRTLSLHVKSRATLLEWARTTINADCV